MRDAVNARETNKPYFIEAMTFRMGDHTTADDARRYRDQAEVDEWAGKCPLKRLRIWLEAQGAHGTRGSRRTRLTRRRMRRPRRSCSGPLISSSPRRMTSLTTRSLRSLRTWSASETRCGRTRSRSSRSRKRFGRGRCDAGLFVFACGDRVTMLDRRVRNRAETQLTNTAFEGATSTPMVICRLRGVDTRSTGFAWRFLRLALRWIGGHGTADC